MVLFSRVTYYHCLITCKNLQILEALLLKMDWETIEALDSLEAHLHSPPPDIRADATVLEEQLQEIVYALNPCSTAPLDRERQRERDREMLEQFHLLGTGGHEFNTEHTKVSRH